MTTAQALRKLLEQSIALNEELFTILSKIPLAKAEEIVRLKKELSSLPTDDTAKDPAPEKEQPASQVAKIPESKPKTDGPTAGPIKKPRF